MKLTNPADIKTLMEANGLRFNKQFGQNFLISEAVPEKIAEQCGAKPEDGILEIGPGIGTLTAALAKRYRKVVAVEIDRNLIPVLGKTLAEFDNVKVINGDILKTDLHALLHDEFDGMRVTVCANLPYYITTPILMNLLETDLPLSYITVMVQKEVADRIASQAGGEGYGAVTASISWYGRAEKLFSVAAGCFMPAPKVDSAVLRIERYAVPPVQTDDRKMLFRVIRAAFAQRRKTLLNSMSGEFAAYSKQTLAELLETAGYEPTVRGETLAIGDFAAIANVISAYTADHLNNEKEWNENDKSTNGNG